VILCVVLYYTFIDVKYGLIASCLLVILLAIGIHQTTHVEGFFFDNEIEESEKPDYDQLKKNAVIPLHIYQTWHTKNLPPKMRECVDKLKRDNPDFTHHLFDDDDCRKFIYDNFDPEVLDAFDKMIQERWNLFRHQVPMSKGIQTIGTVRQKLFSTGTPLCRKNKYCR
jgi:hypothetical protein